MDIDVKIDGVDDLRKVFDNLPRSMQRKAYMQALRAGAQPVRDSAEANIKSVSRPYTGVLSGKNTIRVYNLKKFRGSFRVGVHVRRGLVNKMVKDKNGESVRVGLYAAVLEYGSKKLNRAPRSWIRPAIRSNVQRALDLITKEMSRRMADAVKDAGGK